MSHHHSFSPGETIDERFRIVRLIGSGGMGEVFEAEDLQLRERIALKVVQGLWRHDAERLKRFRREIHLARKVTHPNVCRVFDVFSHHLGSQDELSFVTMELLSGETLQDRLQQQGAMTTEEAAPLVEQMASALGAAHAAGVVHRDFKSGNVLLVPREGQGPRVVVTDFGLARSWDDDEQSDESSVVGSIPYMSPEQLRGEAITPASDLFALGVVMYEMVTGQSPFRGADIVRMVARREREPAPSPRELVPELDPLWEAAIQRCLETEPGDRFGSAAQLVQALRKPEQIPTRAADSRASAPARKLAPALAAALLVVVAALIAVVISTRDVSAPRAFTNFEPSQLTTSPGLEIDPCFSPEADRLVYSSDRSGSFELRIRELGPGGADHPLTEDGMENVQPTWSPDGLQIAYYSEGRKGIWIVPATGGEPRRITDFGSQPAWSPDGRRLVFQAEGKIELSAGSAPAMPPSTIWTAELDGTPPRELTRAGAPPGGHGVPSWTPDGERIVFSTYYRRRSEIWSVRADGTQLVPVVRDQPAAFHPVVTPDGHELLYSAVAEGERYGMWSVPISPDDGSASGEPRLLANLGWVSIRQLALSAGGSRLAYTALATKSNLWSLPVDPVTGEARGEPRALTSGSGRNNRPDLSPDGRRVAFDRWRIGVHRDIWTLDLESGELAQLTSDAASDTQASWQADGDTVLFLSDRDGSWALWSRGSGDPEAQRLADIEVLADGVRLAPGGRRLAYHSRKGQGTLNVWVLDLDGGAPRQLTFDDEMAAFPSWSPDGSRLAFEVRRGADTHVMVMSADGGEPTQLTHQPGEAWPFSWSPDGRWITFAGLREGLWNLWWVAVDDGTEHRLTDLSGRNTYVRYPDWSPRGDRIVYELAETNGDIWMVEDTR